VPSLCALLNMAHASFDGYYFVMIFCVRITSHILKPSRHIAYVVVVIYRLM